ncbi:MAG: rhodanese-like domain-containing protein [Planctomycetota bacterium]|jgi:rhodanese-related sulfurtransferase
MLVTRITTLIALTLLTAPAYGAEESKDRTPAGHTKDSIETVKASIAKGDAVLIDVREKKEWDAGHLKVAKLVPLSKIKTAADSKGEARKKIAALLPKDKTIYFHCRSGGRVLVAEKLVAKYGYDIRPLQHGYEALLKQGFQKAK